LQIEWAGNDGIQSIVATARASFGKPFFMEVVVTACRHIWLLRNGNIFRNERPTFAKWKCNLFMTFPFLGIEESKTRC
jgi:hypothetical protein